MAYLAQALDSSAGMAVLAAASMASGAGEPREPGEPGDPGAKRSSSRMADLSNSHPHRGQYPFELINLVYIYICVVNCFLLYFYTFV